MRDKFLSWLQEELAFARDKEDEYSSEPGCLVTPGSEYRQWAMRAGLLKDVVEKYGESRALNSIELIGRVRERYEELSHYNFEWRSFYNGWIEGGLDADNVD